MQGDIFKAFCRYVDERIFSKENMGSYVALVVDQSFVDDFCREYNRRCSYHFCSEGYV